MRGDKKNEPASAPVMLPEESLADMSGGNGWGASWGENGYLCGVGTTAGSVKGGL